MLKESIAPWNPAVEDRATDRVFRIGQKKNVFVHKFVTASTIGIIKDFAPLRSETSELKVY
jgi:hypothetical protein